MKFIVKEKYGTIPNNVLNDKNISFKAKGIWAYIQSKPNDRDFSAERICLETKDKYDGVATGLRELESNGYLLRVKYQEKGMRKVDYKLVNKENPGQENPGQENPGQENPGQENPLTNKTIHTKQYIQKNKIPDIENADTAKDQINEIINIHFDGKEGRSEFVASNKQAFVFLLEMIKGGFKIKADINELINIFKRIKQLIRDIHGENSLTGEPNYEPAITKISGLKDYDKKIKGYKLFVRNWITPFNKR